METINISFSALSKTFDRSILFRNIDGMVKTGQSLSITGSNGAGKSTLLKILAGIMRPTAGRVVFTGNALQGGPELFSSKIAFTNMQVIPYGDLSGRENISFALGDQGTTRRIDELVEGFALTPHLDKKVGIYSSGMRQRLRLVIALAVEKPVLLMDEPGTNLDDAGRQRLLAYLEEYRASRAIVIATNDPIEERFCTAGIRLGV